MARRLRGSGRYGSKAVADHLGIHLGKPFNTMREELIDGVEISLHGYVDVPSEGQVTLVSEGLSTYFRDKGLARSDGYAQEILMVVDRAFFGEEILSFFLASLAVYASRGELLAWDEPIRISSPVPVGDRQPFILPMPAALFEDEFSFVRDGSAETNFVMLVPIYAEEAAYLEVHDPESFYDRVAEQDVDLSNLGRGPMRLSLP